jgi:hypothetical protein
MTEETIGVHSLPGAPGHHADGNTLQVPKRLKRRMGHNLPDPPLTAIQSLVHVGTRVRHEGSLTPAAAREPIVDG